MRKVNICRYCGEFRARTPVAMGWAHRRCINRYKNNMIETKGRKKAQK